MTGPEVGLPMVTGDDAAARPAIGPASGQAGENGMTGDVGASGRWPPSAAAGQPGSKPLRGHAVSVLADRLAAALVHHEPGWRLPRHSALARRYNVSTAEIDAAIEELAGRHLVRRLADGQIYRASPAEYVIGLEGVAALTTRVDTMGGEFSCRRRQVTWRSPPEDIAWALLLPAEQQVCMVRLVWNVGREPAALCTTYLPGDLARGLDVGVVTGLPTTLNLLQAATVAGIPPQPVRRATDAEPAPPDSAAAQSLVGSPAAVHIEMIAPPPSVARSLRLVAGQPALVITVKFTDPSTERPVALTIAALRPDMFRVIVQTAEPLLAGQGAGRSPASWMHAVDSWDS